MEIRTIQGYLSRFRNREFQEFNPAAAVASYKYPNDAGK
jgi:hypothetical protein